MFSGIAEVFDAFAFFKFTVRNKTKYQTSPYVHLSLFCLHLALSDKSYLCTYEVINHLTVEEHVVAVKRYLSVKRNLPVNITVSQRRESDLGSIIQNSQCGRNTVFANNAERIRKALLSPNIPWLRSKTCFLSGMLNSDEVEI